MEHQNIHSLAAIDIHSHVGPVHGSLAVDCIENGSVSYLLRTMAAANKRMFHQKGGIVCKKGITYTVGEDQFTPSVRICQPTI